MTHNIYCNVRVYCANKLSPFLIIRIATKFDNQALDEGIHLRRVAKDGRSILTGEHNPNFVDS